MLETFISSFLASKILKSISFSCDTGLHLTSTVDLSLNIRVPFCRFQCPFCLFINYPYNEALSDLYVRAVKQELKLYSAYIKESPIKNVYFSGGTPSLILNKLSDILNCIHELFGFRGNVAIEVNPLDLNNETLSKLVNIGITQISIGVQSFNSDVLKDLGRKYGGEVALNAVKKAMDSGFDYVNIDLMFPSPNQTTNSLLQDLEIAVGLGVHGISTYPLMLLPYTEMYRQLKDRIVEIEGMEKKMYMLILDYLMNVGYNVRSIWSFTVKPGFYNGPFEYDEYLGIGPYAWGVIDNAFTVNTPLFEDYIIMVKKKIPIVTLARFEGERSMIIWLSRSLYHGKASKTEFYKRFKIDLDKRFKWLIYLMCLSGLAEWRGDSLRLTRKGLLYGSLTTKNIVIGLLMKMHKATGYYPPL